MPLRIERAHSSLGTGNTAFFVLGYAAELKPHRGTDDFEFLDPMFRINRFQALFEPTSLTTDPIRILERLHYRGILKGRAPARHTLRRLCELFGEHLDIDAGPWLSRGCDFSRDWQSLRGWQRRGALPVLDAARHLIDAFPRLAEPLHAPGLILFIRPDRFCTPRVFPLWVQLIDRLLPAMQLVMTVSESARCAIPAGVLRKRLLLPEREKVRPPRKLSRVRRGTVLLLDVDSQLPNLALMKLSRHFKEGGRTVRLARGASLIYGADEVYASCVFFSPVSQQRVRRLRHFYGDSLVLGGSGVDLQRRLPPEVEALPPDYSLYPELGDRALGFVTRGCPLRCPFCIVPAKEGNIRWASNLDNLMHDGRKKLILLDDNLLAYDKAGEVLEEFCCRDIAVNFTQTLDLRLIDEEKVRLLRRVRCQNTRFTRINYYFSLNNARGLDRVRRRYELFGFRRTENVEFVCMYGFDTSLEEDVRRFQFLKSLPGAYVFVQEYLAAIGGPSPRLTGFFDDTADALIDVLIGIEFRQNMKSMERYYRWVSKQYAMKFGKLHPRLVDTIFRYNKRDQKGRYIASLAGTVER